MARAARGKLAVDEGGGRRQTVSLEGMWDDQEQSVGRTGTGASFEPGERPQVTAVVLTLGEATTERALASVRRQTYPVSAIVVVDGVEPFHRALNAGIAQVKTPFFVQVDADMVLDDDCVEGLLARFHDRAGMVIGYLRDPMIVRRSGIKLWRTACFDQGGLPDTVSPDTDFYTALEERGLATMHALRFADRERPVWHTFGEHSPTYDALYTYSKVSLEGRRWYYRRDGKAVRGHLRKYARSLHPMALLGEIALANGLFLAGDRDLLERYTADADFERLMRFLDGEASPRPRRRQRETYRTPPACARSAKVAFRHGYRLGIRLGMAGARRDFAATLQQLHAVWHPFDWILQVGLCRGLFVPRYDRERFEQDWAHLSVLC